MAFIKSRLLRFTPSTSEDTTVHRIRIIPKGTLFDYTAPFDTTGTLPTDGDKIVVDISTLSVAPTTEGVWDIYVTASDQVGNESDPLEIPDSFFDFTAPLAPTAGSID